MGRVCPLEHHPGEKLTTWTQLLAREQAAAGCFLPCSLADRPEHLTADML